MSVGTRERIAETLLIGQRVEDKYGKVWFKEDDTRWEDRDYRRRNNREIDAILADGGSVVIEVLDLDVEEIATWELEPGDYVVTTDGFHEAGVDSWFEELRSHQLWRVAGWTWHGPNTSTVALDAPQDRMGLIAQENDGGYMPLEMYVDAGMTVRLVKPGQTHNRWDEEWDWSDYVTFVGSRPER